MVSLTTEIVKYAKKLTLGHSPSLRACDLQNDIMTSEQLVAGSFKLVY